eukprot:TRINITY_DN10312_c0_g1_i1.p1 TRINITY_DN10312_c0_g1~~TRINITY_DN10312_c0_g1_i1.p1  ORF type:complete len:607 (+),score=226.41 TRINITY_DN10312_c0_g1_i1:50-1822(+)
MNEDDRALLQWVQSFDCGQDVGSLRDLSDGYALGLVFASLHPDHDGIKRRLTRDAKSVLLQKDNFDEWVGPLLELLSPHLPTRQDVLRMERELSPAQQELVVKDRDVDTLLGFVMWLFLSVAASPRKAELLREWEGLDCVGINMTFLRDIPEFLGVAKGGTDWLATSPSPIRRRGAPAMHALPIPEFKTPAQYEALLAEKDQAADAAAKQHEADLASVRAELHSIQAAYDELRVKHDAAEQLSDPESPVTQTQISSGSFRGTRLRDELARFAEENTELDHELRKARAALDDMQRELGEVREELMVVRSEAHEARAARDVLSSEVTAARELVKDHEKREAGAEFDRETAGRLERELEREKALRASKEQVMRDEATKAQEALDAARGEVRALKAQIESERSRGEEMSTAFNAVEEIVVNQQRINIEAVEDKTRIRSLLSENVKLAKEASSLSGEALNARQDKRMLERTLEIQDLRNTLKWLECTAPSANANPGDARAPSTARAPMFPSGVTPRPPLPAATPGKTFRERSASLAASAASLCTPRLGGLTPRISAGGKALGVPRLPLSSRSLNIPQGPGGSPVLPRPPPSPLQA